MPPNSTGRRWALYAELNPLRRYASMLAERTSSGRLSVLDIGCGFETPTLRKLTGFRVGIDLVPHESFAPAPGVSVLRASGEQLPFGDNTFDVVCCRSVLEHVEDPVAMLSEVRRVLRSGGTFVLITPNRWDYVSLASSLIPNRWHPAIVRAMTGRDEDDTFPTLYRANTVRRLRALTADVGLKVETLELLREHPHYLQRSAILYGFGVAFEQLVQRPFPTLRPWILGVLRRPNA